MRNYKIQLHLQDNVRNLKIYMPLVPGHKQRITAAPKEVIYGIASTICNQFKCNKFLPGLITLIELSIGEKHQRRRHTSDTWNTTSRSNFHAGNVYHPV